MPAKDRESNVSPAVAAALTGLAGGLAVNSSPVERLAFEHFTRQGSPFRPLSNTPIAVGLRNGSGEAMMTNRWQELLKRHGINTTYAPTFVGWDTPGYKTTIGELIKDKRGKNVIDGLKASKAWGTSTHGPTGADIKGLGEVLKQFSPEEYNKFVKLLEKGKYNDLTPGLLRDFALLDKKLALTPDRLGPSGLVDKLGRQGKAKTFFNAFRGFTANNWDAASDLTHLENWNNSNNYGGMFNLGRASGFQANYNAKAKHFIPGTKVYDNWMNNNPITARLAHEKDRKAVIDKIRSISGKGVKLNGKKIIFMDSGSVGPNNTQKILDLVDAVKGRDDVHILFQHGKDTFAKDLLGSNGVLARLSKENPGLITAVERLQPQEMGQIINGSDLHLTYGGSSSAGEAGSHITPTIFTRDAALNDQNLQFVRRTRNALGGTKIRKMDNVHTAIARAIEDFKKRTGQTTITDAQLDALLEGLNKDQLAASKLSRRIAKRIVKDPTYIDKIRARQRNIINEMLSDEVQNARYSTNTLQSARKYIDKVRASDKHLVDTTKSVLSSLIQRDDAQRVNRLGANLKALVSGRTGKMKSTALKRIMSLKGLRDANLALGGLITKNPIGRRAAVPVLALAGLAGVGKHMYDKRR